MDRILRIDSGVIEELYDTLVDNEISGNFLFITSEYLDQLFGEKVKSQIEKAGEMFLEYINDNSIELAMEIAEKVIENDIDYIIGMGGGKVLDVCKYAAYVSKVPFISIPTTMANDGLASPVAVLKKKDGKVKSLGCSMPKVIILDIDFIKSSPIELIKAGIGDTISNYMALKDWKNACIKKKDKMNNFAYLMSENALDALMRTNYTSICPEFIKVLANSLVLSGIAMEFAGNSRPVSGSEHLFSHALDYYTNHNNLHGIQVALGTITMLKLINEDYSMLLEYLNKFEVEINPEKLNITKDEFVLCLQNAAALRKKRYTYLNEVDLNKNKLERIYDELKEEL